MQIPERPLVRNDLLEEVCDNQIVILDRQAARVCELNPTASVIWPRLDGSNDLDSLVKEVCQAFDVDAAVANQDIRLFLSELMELGLLS